MDWINKKPVVYISLACCNFDKKHVTGSPIVGLVCQLPARDPSLFSSTIDGKTQTKSVKREGERRSGKI
jgi:hypothetical protein